MLLELVGDDDLGGDSELVETREDAARPCCDPLAERTALRRGAAFRTTAPRRRGRRLEKGVEVRRCEEQRAARRFRIHGASAYGGERTCQRASAGGRPRRLRKTRAGMNARPRGFGRHRWCWSSR